MAKNSSHITLHDGKYYCLLPNRCYREVPYINWVEDIDWKVVYYKLYNKLIAQEVTYDDLKNLPLQWLLEKIDILV